MNPESIEHEGNGVFELPLSRRDLLRKGLAGAAWLSFMGLAGFMPFEAQGSEDPTLKASAPFHWGRVRFDTKAIPGMNKLWDAGASYDPFFLSTMKKTTNINVDTAWREVHLDNLPEMCKFPMLFFTANSSFELPESQERNLKEYIERGGFILGDDCVSGSGRIWDGDEFFQCFRAMAERLFRRKMEKLPNDHPVYHNIYDLDNGAPFNQGKNHGGHALNLNGNISVVLTPGDIHCGWGSYQGRMQTGRRILVKDDVKSETDSIKFAVNLIAYAMGNA